MRASAALGQGLRVVAGRAGARADEAGVAARGRRPSDGAPRYTLRLAPSERRAVARALRGRSFGWWAREALCRAAGAPAPPLGNPRDAGLSPRAEQMFVLAAAERAAVDRARLDRTFGAWVRDALRAAAGLRRTRWTACADATLRKHFRRADRAALAAALPGHTPAAVARRAHALGCAAALSGERLSVAAAAARFGYDDKQFKALLAAAGVAPRRLMTGRPGAQRPRLIVTLDEAARAHRVAAARERLAPGARARGVGRRALAAELARRGVRRGRRERFWWLPSAVLDEAAAAVRARRAAARLARRRARARERRAAAAAARRSAA